MVLNTVQSDGSVVEFTEPMYLCCELPTRIIIK